MVLTYPASIDTAATLPPFLDGQPIVASQIEKLRKAIIAVEAELGIRPAGIYTTVRARLDAMETAIANLHIISLANDLGGTLLQPKVIGIQGRPVSDAEPEFNQVLTWDGIAWVPADAQGGGGGSVIFAGDLRGSNTSQTTVGINTIPVRNGHNFGFDQGFLKAQSILSFSSCVVFDGTYIWATSFNDNLVKINPDTPEIVTYISLPATLRGSDHQAGIAYDATHVFVGSMGTNGLGMVYVIRKSDNAIVGLLESPYPDGKIFGLAINGDDFYVASGDPSLAITNGTESVSQISKFSKADILAAYPLQASAIGGLAPTLTTAYHGGFLFHNGFLYVTSATLDGQIYKIDSDMTTVDTYSSGPGSVMTNLVFVNGGLWTGHYNLSFYQMSKFDPDDLASGPIPTHIDVIIGARGFSEFLSVHANRWIVGTHGNSSFIEVIDTNPGVENVGDNDLEDGGMYGVSASDGTYIWTANSSSSPTGVGITLMNTSFINSLGINVHSGFTGDLEIVYSTLGLTVPKETILIYRPGIAGGGNIYDNWTNLMNARGLIEAPVTILVDDRFSTPAQVDAGTWDLSLTKFTGYSKDAILDIPINATIISPREFENIVVNASRWNTFQGSIHMTGNKELILRNARLGAGTNGGNENKGIYFADPAGVNLIQLYGNSWLNTNDNFSPVNIADSVSLTVEMYDSSYMSDSVFLYDSAASTVNIHVYDDGVTFDPRQGDPLNYFPFYHTAGPLTFQPGGGGPGNQRVFTEWASLMSARSTISGPCTIYVDSSITSPADIPPGEWDFHNNTKLIGNKGTFQSGVSGYPYVRLLEGCIIIDPCEFENLLIEGTSNTDQNIMFLNPMNINLRDTYITNTGSASVLSPQSGSYADVHSVYMYGQSKLTGGGGPILGTNINGVFQVVLNDNSVVEQNTINFTGTIAQLVFLVNSPSAIYTQVQTATTVGIQAQMGEFNYSTADRVSMIGTNGSATMTGQFVDSFGPVNGIAYGQYNVLMVGGNSTDAAATVLKTAANIAGTGISDFVLKDGVAYIIKATCIANRRFVAGRSAFVHTIFAHCSGGVATIDSINLNQSFPNGNAWTIAYTTSGANIIATFTTTGLIGEANALVTYEWSEIGAGV